MAYERKQRHRVYDELQPSLCRLGTVGLRKGHSVEQLLSQKESLGKRKDKIMAISRLAGRRAEASILINASRLVTAYYAEQSDVLYIKALAAPFTVNTMPEGTLKALTNHKELDSIMPADGGDCEEVLAQFAKAGIDIDDLAAKLQSEGATLFDNFWNELMTVIASKCTVLQKAG
jgi:transaldolase